ncbi:MAG: NYN domain-containing protein [Candidatus Magasanikbacteria bacterium]|nr:NYN domain-containing protein [Candidatus Magasanikbacteria bacterium]
MIKHPDQRVGIFIDVQNLYYSARNLFNARVNFGEIVKTGVAGRKLIRAIAYVVSTPTGEEKPFFEALVNLGIETKVRELQIFLGGAKKADWDVGIAVDMIRLSELLDIIIIVSGDGDYVEVVEYLQNRGRQVEAMAFRETASSRLIESVDGFTDLSAHKELFLIGTGGRQNRASTARRGRSAK